MEAEPIRIASAVVVPSQDDTPERPKRRQPSSELPEASKRLRFNYGDSENGAITTEEAAGKVGMRTERLAGGPGGRRKTGADEERKRGKRLFGALLGTIGKFQKETSSQRARSNAVKRREVEAKLEEKMKLQTEELDEQRKKDNDNINLRKRVERRDFEERAMEIRHSNFSAQANMLATTATPKLFYLPWKLLPSEENSIEAQIESTNAVIETERREFQKLREKDDEEIQAAGGIPDLEPKVEPKVDVPDSIPGVDQSEQPISYALVTTPVEDIVEAEVYTEENDTHPLPKVVMEDASTKETVHSDIADDRRNSDVGDMADIIEEGGEDTVIY